MKTIRRFTLQSTIDHNLISYPHKDKSENVSRVGDIRTRFDDENYLVGPSYPSID